MKVAIREMPAPKAIRAFADAAAARGDQNTVMVCWRAWEGDRAALVKVAEMMAQAAPAATE